MSGTLPTSALRDLVAGGFGVAADWYHRRADASWYYAGERPGPTDRWHRHGTLPRQLWVIDHGQLVRIVLRKQRWLDVETGRTCHSRSPLESRSTGFATLVVALSLWVWLDLPSARSGHERVTDGPTDLPSTRTVQRWLRRALDDALMIQQALRDAVSSRCEPRPKEQLFKGGLSPPELLLRKRWRARQRVETLWTGLAMLFKGAIALSIHPSMLLAEARGREEQPPLPI